LNQRPPGYEPGELPGCSTPRQDVSSLYAPREANATPFVTDWCHSEIFAVPAPVRPCWDQMAQPKGDPAGPLFVPLKILAPIWTFGNTGVREYFRAIFTVLLETDGSIKTEMALAGCTCSGPEQWQQIAHSQT